MSSGNNSSAHWWVLAVAAVASRMVVPDGHEGGIR
jgi:hypothetical protein